LEKEGMVMMRIVLKLALVSAMVVCLASPGFAQEKVIKWKVQGFVPAGMLYHETLQRTAEEVKSVSKGRLVWEVFPAGALVPPLEGLKAVSDGVYDVNFGYTGQWVGKIPVAPLFTAAPGGLNALDMQMWLEHGGGKELHQEMYDKYGYKVKVIHDCPIAMEIFMWSKKPLKNLDDWKGMKFRMMPLMGDILAKHGLSVVFMPAGEIMPNLQRGVIDAAEYSIPAFDKTLGIWEVCKYLHLPGVHQPASQLEHVINKKSYDALPDDLKVALDAAIWKSRLKNWLWMESKNMEAMDFFKQKGIEVVQVEPESVKTMMKWAIDYLDEKSATDEFFAKVWKSQKEFGEKWYPYTKAFSLPH
jgi:TRAP-type mannitol/chloroaromatic compound transport system substrate-binding protein